jgi:hypothetical protein
MVVISEGGGADVVLRVEAGIVAAPEDQMLSVLRMGGRTYLYTYILFPPFFRKLRLSGVSTQFSFFSTYNS